MDKKPELRPQPGPQEMFLKSEADIAIYGGAAGSGKSFALLLEPLYHVSKSTIPRQFCFAVARFRELKLQGGLWDTSENVIIPQPGRGGEPVRDGMAVLLSGAVVNIRGLEHPQDRFQLPRRTNPVAGI